MYFWRASLLAIGLACGGALLAQTPRPVGTGVPRPTAGPSAQAEAPYVTRRQLLRIPLDLRDVAGGEMVSVQTFFSIDQGRTWRKYKLVDVPPDRQDFLEFLPPQDGEYWLTAVRLDETRAATFSLAHLSPQKRIIFDWQKPKLVLMPEAAPNGEVLVAWEATDERLDPATLVVEYQAGGKDSEWLPIEIDPRDVTAIDGGLEGRARFQPPPTARLVNVRAGIRDKAGNPASVQRVIALAASGASDSPATRTVKSMTPIHPDALAAAKPIDLTPNPPPAETRSAPAWTKRPTNPRAEPIGQRLGSGAFGEVPAFEKQSPGRLAGFPRQRDDVGPVTSDEAPPTAASSQPTQPEPPPELDPYAEKPRLLNKKRFNLDYDVESVGVAGVADVELWGTSDRGQSWMKWGADPDLKSPLEVDVSNEAVYGFRIVVVSRNGLTSPPPRPGDPADVWVQIDCTPPQCRLTSVTYGQGEEAGKLDIRWEAADASLAERPVTLLMSDRPDAGYSVIAAGLPNSGQYLWPYDPRAPQLIYLRLEVRDEAGNLGSYQLTEPIRVEGLTPKGRIRSVAPVESSQRSPFRANLFK
jgi:hypothetical protein